jgi:hypothetical protein
MISDLTSDDLGKCCSRCATAPGELEFKESCPEHPSGKHRLVNWEMFVAVGSFTAYAVRSEAVALRIFEESCGGDGEVARKLTPEELTALRTGQARLKIVVERI